MTVSTNDMYSHADYIVKVEAQLADNDDIKAQPVELTVTLKNCDVNSIEYPTFGGSESVINIRFDGTEHTTHFDEFVAKGTEPCGYTWTYQAYLDGEIDDALGGG